MENSILRETAVQMRKTGRAAYQENILKDLLEDLAVYIKSK
jgi:hypothetical protein